MQCVYFVYFCRLLQENIPAKELERRGVCLLRLVIASRHMGLYGRTVLQFETAKDLPSHSFTPGNEASCREGRMYTCRNMLNSTELLQ